jgi:acyl-lipid (8-3)-desaturase
MWKQQHVVGHHQFTNVNSEDPDVRVNAIRLTPWQPHAAHHVLQHLYVTALYGLLSIKTILLNDFEAHASGNIGPVQIRSLRGHELVTMYAGKVLFAGWYVVAPLIWSSWSVPHLLGLWTVSQLVTGWTLAFMFQVCFHFCGTLLVWRLRFHMKPYLPCRAALFLTCYHAGGTCRVRSRDARDKQESRDSGQLGSAAASDNS